MEVIDLTAEIEAPKVKSKARAKSKAKTEEPSEPTVPAEPKAKAKAKPRAKAKAAVEAPLVDAVEEIEPPEEPPVEPPEEPPAEPVVEEPIKVEAETTTRKPKGHRPKIENKEKLTKKVNCKKCDKKVSLHSIKYTHDKFCNKNEVQPTATTTLPAEVEKPLTLRQKLEEKRVATAQRLISQCFKS